MQFFALHSSNIDVFELAFFFDIVITKSDHPTYVTHVLGPMHMAFAFFEY